MATKREKQQFYLGNESLPTQDAVFDYSSNPEWIKDMDKCKKNILFFAENFFYITNLDEGKIKIQLHLYQKRILRSLRDNRFVVMLSSRQSGKTTLFTIYALWIVCFQEDQRVLIVANKEATAINIFKRVRMAYEKLPNYLKPGVIEYGKTSMTLANGSSIGISTTSSDAGRGDSVNVVLLDELAFIDNHLVEEFWASVYPIISSSKKSKIFVASTPNGTGNLFHELYEGAMEEDLEKHNGWKAERVDWWEVPGRDEKWKLKTIREMGSREKFDQEFGNCVTGESHLDVINNNNEQQAITIKELFDLL
jgi:Terminase large subunit, T4likevirus-type, N-terminal